MWLLENAPHGNSTDGARELQRSGGDSTLSSRDGNGFSGIPLAMKHALDPFLGRHQASFFGRKINAGAVAQTHFCGVVREAIDAEFHAHVVEKNVAGIENGFAVVDNAVRALAIHPALKLASIEGGVAGAKRGVALRRHFVFEHGSGGNNFKNGAGSELGLNGAIEQWVKRIFV